VKTASVDRDGLRELASQDTCEAPPYCLDIEIDERAGSVRVYDPRAFYADRRGFCRRLLEAVTRRPGVSRAEVDLSSATCRIEFGAGLATSRDMAGAFADSVREAAAGSPNGGRTPWWRRTAGWVALTAYTLPGGVSVWETLEVKPGRIRLRHQEFAGDHVRLSRLADALSTLPEVAACHVRPWSSRLTIEIRQERTAPVRFLDKVERTWENLLAAGPLGSKDPERGLSEVGGASTEVATGLKRLKYLALAGGSFAMTLVGLVVPGIPTVPFLLATSYYLARSSPRLDGMLRRTAFFGGILSEWEQHHALSRWSKGKLVGLTLTIVVVTLALTPLTPVALIVILLVSSLSLYEIARLPALPEEPRPVSPLGRPARVALSAP
jgi:uncharacterized membrane protein YbaN (DUF454 family)